MYSGNEHSSQKIIAGKRQNGFALLIFVLIISLATISTLYSKFTVNNIKTEKEKETIEALKTAKEALIAYSLNSAYLNPSPSCTSNSNCPRPGDLPCPDTNNDGNVESGCGNASGASQQVNRLGRLPWKSLGLGDLRDGYGERLWYAVSNSYKYNTRSRPLNSDTAGTITVRDSSGRVIYDATTGGGVAAVIIAPGQAIQRQDGVKQDRSTSQENTSTNYLDNALGEDNADFIDSGSNGFIIGPIKDSNGNEILNDRLIVITRDEMAAAMESYVLTQVRDALLTYYTANSFYPNPASFSDSTCIVTTSANINSGCAVVASVNHGRIPVTDTDGVTSIWTATSILRGLRAGNWFQQNLWRELIYYAVAPACESGTTNCNSSGYLTLNTSSDKQVVIISAGHTLSGQSRTTKLSESNYLESENLSPLDDTYIRSSQTNSVFNDRAMSIP